MFMPLTMHWLTLCPQAITWTVVYSVSKRFPYSFASNYDIHRAFILSEETTNLEALHNHTDFIQSAHENMAMPMSGITSPTCLISLL